MATFADFWCLFSSSSSCAREESSISRRSSMARKVTSVQTIFTLVCRCICETPMAKQYLLQCGRKWESSLSWEVSRAQDCPWGNGQQLGFIIATTGGKTKLHWTFAPVWPEFRWRRPSILGIFFSATESFMLAPLKIWYRSGGPSQILALKRVFGKVLFFPLRRAEK